MSSTRDRVDIPPGVVETFADAVQALERGDIPVLLGGALAARAHGQLVTVKRIVFYVRPSDIDRACSALAGQGMRSASRGEGGRQVRIVADDVVIDLVSVVGGREVDDAVFSRASELAIAGQPMLVASAGDVLSALLEAIDRKEPDFGPALTFVRATTHVPDWDHVREVARRSPFALAFMFLVEQLDDVRPIVRLARTHNGALPPKRGPGWMPPIAK